MHTIIENELENYLVAKPLSAAFHAHLGECADCRESLALFSEASRLVRTLRVETDEAAALELSPGFYARVLQKIEAEEKPSVWDIFLQPFGRKLVFASLALFAVMTAAIFWPAGPEPEVIAAAPETMFSTDTAPKAMLVDHRVGNDENRGAVLVQLTTLDQ
ncbi:MAG: hypothetical protein K2X03_15120 [Bryobacteraceae bacterium]|nr:hypothetical protein [Bryobacteraceae bacterium]